MSIIYKITCIITNKVYIGWTNKTAEQRWKVHVQCAKRGQKSHLYNAIRLHGKENFIIEEIECGDDDNYMLNVREPYYISLFKESELYNMTKGGEGGVTSTSFKKEMIPHNKNCKMPSVSKKKKEYWEEWRKKNPNYKDNWKRYIPKGISEEDRENRKARLQNLIKNKHKCEYCGKECDIGNYNRWHGEKCKTRL